MQFSFKNRIALYYMIATALVVALVFIIIFTIVKSTVYQNLDNLLGFEANKHIREVEIRGDSIVFINKKEWEEHEHLEAETNPVFIQISNKNGVLMDKSPNLKSMELKYHDSKKYGSHFNTLFKLHSIRQVQQPIMDHGNMMGYIMAAMSSESTNMVLVKLRNIMLILYPLILLGLFFISRFLAGRSINPIVHITNTTNQITKHNLNQRVDLPKNGDELYQLSSAINGLLQRLENAMNRERQFTTDASHELRTPIAALRGTLEVLLRKPRNVEEYQEKIRIAIKEIDRISYITEALLVMAKIENQHKHMDKNLISIVSLIDDILGRNNDTIVHKNISIQFDTDEHIDINVPQYYSQLILENIIGNAIKYTNSDGRIKVNLYKDSTTKIVCSIHDTGIGIHKDDLEQIFQPFFRSDALSHKMIKGNGLGLSIAKKAADTIGVVITVESEKNKGTKVLLSFS